MLYTSFHKSGYSYRMEYGTSVFVLTRLKGCVKLHMVKKAVYKEFLELFLVTSYSVKLFDRCPFYTSTIVRAELCRICSKQPYLLQHVFYLLAEQKKAKLWV